MYAKGKDALQTFPDFAADFASFLAGHDGENIVATEYQAYTGPCEGIVQIRGEARQFGNIKREADFYESMVKILNIASQEVAGSDLTKVVFNSNPKKRLRVSDGGEDKPDLVAYMDPNVPGTGVASTQTADNVRTPTAHELVAAVEIKLDGVARGANQCMRYLFALSRHRPASSIQYGIMANKSSFMLLALGLDAQILWPRVRWVGENDEVTDANIRKLYGCVKYIHDEASRIYDPSVPKFVRTVEKYPVIVGIYNAEVDKKQFSLLPIFTGRGNGRKPFVVVAAAKENYDDIRVLKYSWHMEGQLLRERRFLERLQGAPGVVRIDEQLCMESIQEDYAPEYASFDRHDAASARKRSLLALKTIGHPLSACSSVLEFLEAMYDLLEVLRYLVQEEGILHRDVSWGNVLIRPRPGDNVRGKTVSECPADGVEHHYRFISNIYNESELKVRIALADFDYAFDLRGVKDDLKNATGTPMFMASDVIDSSPILVGLLEHMGPYVSDGVRQATRSVPSNNQKYNNAREEEFWNEFYLKKLKDLKWVGTEFTHGAVHDAESVFCICLLFFNRMWPQGKTVGESDLLKLKKARGAAFAELASKRVGVTNSRAFVKTLPADGFDETFYNMLKTIHGYLSQPWYNVSSTGRGEAYEFHLHDFMQRLFLKEIDALRNNNILVDDCPLPVVATGVSSGNAYASLFRLTSPSGTSAAKRGIEDTEDLDTGSQSKRKKTSGQTDAPMSEADRGLVYKIEGSDGNKLVKPTPSPTKVLSSADESTFSEDAWNLFYERRIDALWFKCDID